jgi:ferrous iron transport protein B
VWFLQTFDFRLNVVTDSANSILAVVAGKIAPLFAPLGFGDWRVVTALIAGFIAKESVVSTLSVLFGSTASLLGALSTRGAAALLVFCLLYTPCVAAIASIRRELGAKWALAVVLGQCAIAWVCALVIYLVYPLATSMNAASWAIALAVALAIFAAAAVGGKRGEGAGSGCGCCGGRGDCPGCGQKTKTK